MPKAALAKRVGLIAFEAVVVFFYARLRILNSFSIRSPRISFGDTGDYLLIASHPIFSPDFWLADKPILIPLFFKLLGSDPGRIFAVQLAFSILCWVVLAVTCALVIRSYPLKFLAFGLVLGFSLTEQVILWDSLLLTESLHFSLAALLYSSALLLSVRWSRLNAAVLIVLAALLAFTRDVNAYMLLMAGAVLLALLLLFRQQPLRLALIGGSFVVLFLVSTLMATLGQHGTAALLNVITTRILPDKEYTAFMAQEGMPLTYLNAPDSANVAEWNALQDPRLSSLRTWADAHGKIALIKLLWHFKADTLQKPLEDAVTVLAPDLHYYSSTGFRPILEPTRWAEILYPQRFGVITFGLASLGAAFLSAFALQQKRLTWLLPLLMILLAYPQIVFIWNSDPHDIYRHALPLNVQWRLGCWLLLLLLANDLIERFAPALQRRLSRIRAFGAARGQPGAAGPAGS